MQLRWTWLLLWLIALVALAAPARTDPWIEGRQAKALVAHHPMLRSSLERISSGSRLWREALQTLEESGRRAIVLTPDQVQVQDSPDSTILRSFDPGLLAEVSPVIVSGSQVPEVLVVVNVPLLRRLYHAQRWSSPADVNQDLDRIVIHEVYGHAFPYLLAGDVSGRCPDATPGQRAIDACAIQRENAVRSELRLGLRRDAGLNGLALTRRER
jgi:hypothetical protein